LIKQQFFRFVCVGIANTAFSYLLYILFRLVVPYEVAYTVAYVLAIGFSYWLNSTWVYRVTMSLRTFLQFPLVYVVQYVINIMCLHVLVEKLLVPQLIAPFFVIVINIPITFILSRWIIVR
jgi:putative flippase GtrA